MLCNMNAIIWKALIYGLSVAVVKYCPSRRIVLQSHFFTLILLDFLNSQNSFFRLILARFGVFFPSNCVKHVLKNRFTHRLIFWHLDGVNGRIVRKIYRLHRAKFLYLSHLPTFFLQLFLLPICTWNLLCCFLRLSKLLHLFLRIIQFKMCVSIKRYGDIAMPHQILKHFRIHAGLCHITTIGMTAYVWMCQV